MKRILVLFLTLAMILSVVTACGTPQPAAPATTTAAPATSAAAAADTTLVGISMPTRTAERWIIEGDFMKAGLESAGYEVDLQFANDQVDQQVSQVENMITRGAKFLIICPIDGASMSAPLAQAKAQNIQILAYDRLLMETQDVDYFVGFDSTRIGNHMGNSLMKGINADAADPANPLYIELFAGSLDDSNTHLYFDGAVDMIQPYLDSGKVVVKSGQTSLNECATPGWDGLVAQNRMQNLLSAHYTDDILAGALSPYDGLSLGMIGALKAVGYGSADKPMAKVTGQDCELPSLISIWNDEQYSSIFLDLEVLAGRAVEVCEAMLKGTPLDMTTTYNNDAKDVAAYLADAFELTKETIPKYFFERGEYTEADLALQ